MAFVPRLLGRDNNLRCSECNLANSDHEKHGFINYLHIPLLPRLARISSDKGQCKEVYRYRKDFRGNKEILRDYFDGQKFAALCKQYGGEANLKDDIFLAFSTDGFQPFKNRTEDLCIFATFNFNLAPCERYKPRKFLSLGFVPGPR